MRFLFFNKTSESNCQLIPGGLTLIESHCYEVNLLIRGSLTIDLSFYITGDKFSVGAVNFHSVWRLIVGYLTERSMWRNFDNSEHLLGLTEGQKSVPLFYRRSASTEFLPWWKSGISYVSLGSGNVSFIRFTWKYHDIQRNLSTWRFYVSTLSF